MLNHHDGGRQGLGKRGQDKAERFKAARGSGQRYDVERASRTLR
jgi:hypothetical protein